jgi:hypothetical protein
LRNYFAGGRIRKTETDFFEIQRSFGFRPAGECGRNAGRIPFWIFGEAGFQIKTQNGKIFL